MLVKCWRKYKSLLVTNCCRYQWFVLFRVVSFKKEAELEIQLCSLGGNTGHLFSSPENEIRQSVRLIGLTTKKCGDVHIIIIVRMCIWLCLFYGQACLHHIDLRQIHDGWLFNMRQHGIALFQDRLFARGCFIWLRRCLTWWCLWWACPQIWNAVDKARPRG